MLPDRKELREISHDTRYYLLRQSKELVPMAAGHFTASLRLAEQGAVGTLPEDLPTITESQRVTFFRDYTVLPCKREVIVTVQRRNKTPNVSLSRTLAPVFKTPLQKAVYELRGSINW